MKIDDLQNKKVAIVCDWLTNQGGAEHVVYQMHKAFPDAPIYTAVYNSEALPQFKNADIRTSFIQNLPFAKKKHQLYLSLYPHAFESFNLDEYDIVISSSSSCAKGVITKPGTVHICYCHSPMRYAWDGSQRYIAESNFPWLLKKTIIPWSMTKMRVWDRLSADRVDYYVANSEYVGQRIQKYYQRESDVIYPPVDIEKFHLSRNQEEYFLAIGRLIPYKKFDLIVEVFNDLGWPLKIVGVGPEMTRLKKMAKNNIKFLGFVDDDYRADLYSECQACIFPQVEDFGIVPIETMASGRPVIAYSRGGATESMIDEETGIFFDEQTPESLKAALEKFKTMRFNQKDIRKHAEKFTAEHFRTALQNYVSKRYTDWQRKIESL